MGSRLLLLAIAGFALAGMLATAAPAQAHAYLDASTPPPNGNTAEGKTVLALRFTEVIDPDHTTVRLLGPNGSALETALDTPSDRPRVVRVEVEPLQAGTYELRWSTFSIDSHVDRGGFIFAVGASAGPLTGPNQAFDPEAQDQGLVLLESIGRLVFLAGALLAFGLPIYLSEVEPGEIPPKGSTGTLVASGLAGTAGVVLLFAVMVERLGTSAWVAVQTLPGLFLAGKAGLLSVVALLAYWAGHRAPEDRMRPLLACVAAATIAIVLHSMSGHGVLEMTARESAAGHVAMSLHMAASGIWFGGLLGLLLTVRDRIDLVERIRAFTPLAIVSVLAIGGTGLLQAYVHLPSLSSLWTSSFGWALIVKTGLFGLVLGLGAWHGFRLPQRLGSGRAQSKTFLASGTTEAALLAGTLLAAASMGALPVPSDGVDTEDGPLAVFEQARHLPNHDLRLRILEDPIRAGEPVPVDLSLEPTSSVGADSATVNASFRGPSNRSVSVELRSAGSAGPADVGRLWRDPGVVLPEPGPWTLTLELTLPSGMVTERFDVTVQPSPVSD